MKKSTNQFSTELLPELIQKRINFLCSYLEDKSIDFIFNSCNIRPLERPNSKLILNKHWIDDFNNSIIINKPPTIIYNDLSVKSSITDPYRNLSIDKIIKISKLGHFINEEIPILTFYGLDNKLRSYILEDQWNITSTLIIGFSNIKYISNNLNINNYKKNIDNNSWVFKLPCSNEFLSVLKLNNNSVESLFNK